MLQLLTAFLWLGTFASTALALAGAGNVESVLYHWPPAALVVASALALAASVLAFVGVPYLPAVWRGRGGAGGWGIGRKVRFTVILVIFAAFGALLAMWGALQPWHG